MSDKRHILVLSQFFYPEQFRINDICKEWVQRGYKVTVVTGIPNYPKGKFYEGYGLFKNRKENWNGIDIIRLPLIPRGKSTIGLIANYLSFPVSQFFWMLFTSIDPDVIFMFETSPMTQCMLGVWLKNKLKRHDKKIELLGYIQDLWPENVEIMTGIHSPLVIRPIEKMVRYIYRNCDYIFATSPSFVDAIRSRIESEKEKVIYWPQYAEDHYQPVDHTIANEEILKIIFTGNIGYAQGLDILPRTVACLKNRDISVKFLIVGDGRYRQQMQEEIEKAQLSSFFEFLGYRPSEDIPQLFRDSDVAFLSFMKTELFAKTIPAKLQTYLACGMPVLASAEGETKRIIDESNCGMCTPLGDEVALAKAIEEMQEKLLAERDIWSKNARQYYETHFDKTSLLNQMDMYLNI